MGVADLPRWVWLVVALAVGLAHGWVRDYSSVADPLDDYVVLLTDQRQFEHALTAEPMGHRIFTDVTVYPHWVRNSAGGGKRLVHLVTGGYWDGRTEAAADGVRARWEPACFIAPVPYEPLSPVEGATASGTVVDYLAALNRNRGVQYRYAWWWWMLKPTFTSLVASLVLIGGVLPTGINLLAFGMLTQPKREKRPSLWRVRLRRSRRPGGAVATPAAVRTPRDPTAVAEDATAEPVAGVEAVAPLAPADDMPVTVAAADADRHFGARPDDFYPTEVHVAPPHDPKEAC